MTARLRVQLQNACEAAFSEFVFTAFITIVEPATSQYSLGFLSIHSVTYVCIYICNMIYLLNPILNVKALLCLPSKGKKSRGTCTSGQKSWKPQNKNCNDSTASAESASLAKAYPGTRTRTRRLPATAGNLSYKRGNTAYHLAW